MKKLFSFSRAQALEHAERAQGLVDQLGRSLPSHGPASIAGHERGRGRGFKSRQVHFFSNLLIRKKVDFGSENSQCSLSEFSSRQVHFFNSIISIEVDFGSGKSQYNLPDFPSRKHILIFLIGSTKYAFTREKTQYNLSVFPSRQVILFIYAIGSKKK